MTGVDEGVVAAGRAGAATAACRGVDPELFFGPSDSPEGGPMAGWELGALAVCEGCPLVEQCLQRALEFPATEQYGVVGAMTAGQRRQVLRLTRRRATRSYLAGMVGLPVVSALPREVDELVVARLMAGGKIDRPRRAEVAHAAVELARAGHTPGWIAARLGEHDRQVSRWLERHRAGEPLTGRRPSRPAAESRPGATRDGAAA